MRRRKANSRSKRAAETRKRASRVSSPVGHGQPLRQYRAPRPSSLSPSQLKIRADALGAHADMFRNPKLSASQAAKEHGVSVRDFWRFIPKAFKKDSRGRILAIPDRYVRRLYIPGPDGPVLITIRGSKARSDVSRFR